ncbi:MAG: complex I subunit 5 family protein [Lachnospiraceae bacterium]|nr:complex I subunit 5 family protein [Lachnospiraceae bacterium]
MLLKAIVFFPFAGALISWIAGRKNEGVRDAWVCVVTAVELLMCLLLLRQGGSAFIGGIFASGISLQADGFRSAYAIVAAVMWLFTTVFSQEYFREERRNLNRYWLFILFTLGATEGVMLSADFMTAYIFFEILSMTSFTWVIHEETKEAIRAGITYLFVAVIGGLILFMGLLLLAHSAGTLTFSELPAAVAGKTGDPVIFAAGICILLGFGAKAGMFPLHIWLPKAHPVAPSPASALLSGILTKVGIYGILMTITCVMTESAVFGYLVLAAGVITMFLGALLALFSVNLKRTLACSSMSQIGFILTGAGMYVLICASGAEEESGIALAGLMLHMVNHSSIKLTLFMAAGVVLISAHALNLNEIRGWGRKKPLIKAAFALGALGISGVPLFNGFISKTLLHESILEGIAVQAASAGLLKCVEWIFLVSGGCTFAYMLKLFLCVFIEKNEDTARQASFDAQTSYMNIGSGTVIFGSSLVMIVLGQPFIAKALASVMTGTNVLEEFSAFSWENLKGGLISLGIGALIYLLFVRKILMRENKYRDLWPSRLDLEDSFYRPVGRVLILVGTFTGRVLADSMDSCILLLRRTVLHEHRPRTKSDRIGLMDQTKGAIRAMDAFSGNFSFALMMACIGILLILSVLVLLSILHVNIDF